MGLKVPPLSWFVPLATSPRTSKSHLINISPAVVEKVSLCITRYPFHLDGSEEISGTKDKGPNRTEKGNPIALIAQDIPKVWGGEPRTTKEDSNTYLL